VDGVVVGWVFVDEIVEGFVVEAEAWGCEVSVRFWEGWSGRLIGYVVIEVGVEVVFWKVMKPAWLNMAY